MINFRNIARYIRWKNINVESFASQRTQLMSDQSGDLILFFDQSLSMTPYDKNEFTQKHIVPLVSLLDYSWLLRRYYFSSCSVKVRELFLDSTSSTKKASKSSIWSSVKFRYVYTTFIVMFFFKSVMMASSVSALSISSSKSCLEKKQRREREWVWSDRVRWCYVSLIRFIFLF